MLSWSSWTHAKVLHLLPSCNPQWLPYKTLASQQQDHLETVSVLPDVEHRHLFTDGSCIGGKIPEYALSAWAVVDPKIDSWVARGTLGGLGHGADHAELRAVIQATEMVSLHGNRVTIWTDCAYVAEGMNRMLTDVRDVPQGTHEEDWLELQGLLVDCTTSLSIQHTPGHVRCGFDTTGRRDGMTEQIEKLKPRNVCMVLRYFLYIVNFGKYMNAKLLTYAHYKIFILR